MGTEDNDMHIDEITERCRWARDHNQEHPSGEWSLDEQLAVALVLRDRNHLETLGYDFEQATDQVCRAAGLNALEFTGWLNDIRKALENDQRG
ncbi:MULTISPECIES: hypothetical protein [Actinopolyspora]|nr:MULTISPECIES: hypothetical protein [Actinopolyspora]NHD15637.1 hypothetical protein [Actinopolyspora sp. BKK2]NHE75150.1 hypothetical protein [Actinopolyspora sp. BKK1]